MAEVAEAVPGRMRSERLEARVTAEQKSLIEHAAALEGRSVTDFVLASVQEAARRTIEAHEQLELSVRDRQAVSQGDRRLRCAGWGVAGRTARPRP